MVRLWLGLANPNPNPNPNPKPKPKPNPSQVRLAATLGPRWHSQRTPLTQLVVPPLFMHQEFHHRSYVPLCATRGDTPPPTSGAGVPLCRANTARRQLLLFYQARVRVRVRVGARAIALGSG